MRLISWLLGLVALIGGGLVAFTWTVAKRIEKALPPSGRFLQIGDCRLHYVDEGAGPPIVLIHGLSGQLLNFLPAGFAPLRRDYRVVAVDRPGSGYSTRPASASAALGAQAATIAAFIKALGLDRPLIVGHSFGGAVALALALDHPECIGGLALVAPATHPTYTVPKLFRGLAVRSPLVRQVVGWTIAIPGAMRHRAATMPILFGPEPVSPDFPIAAGGVLGLRPSSYYAGSSDLVAMNDDFPGYVARYGSIKVPVGVLYGRGDRVLDHVKHGLAMRSAIPGLTLELVEGGHMLPVTQPETVVGFIRRMAEQVFARTERKVA